MKKSLAMLAALTAVASTLAPCSLHADDHPQGNSKAHFVQNLEAGKKQTIVTFGTSLTAVGAWVDQFATVLEQTYPGQATVINGAQGGANSDWGVKSLDEKVLRHKPDTVLIEFAVNDAVGKRRTSVEHARNNLEQLIERILKANPKTEIILQVMNIPVAHTRTGRPNLEAFNQMYRDVAEQRGYQLIDHWPNWEKLLNEEPLRFLAYTPDTIHPVREGSLHVITPHLLRELGLPAGHPEKSTDTPCWKYLLHVMRTDKKNTATTRQDFDAYWAKNFKQSDLDNNDSLSPEETQADSLLKALDKNQSNTVELDEWASVFAAQFEAFDRDKDGSLSREEKQQLVATPSEEIDLIATGGFQLNKNWQVKDGILSDSPTPGGILWSKDSYSNFEISLEYKTSTKCNSGLFFRADPRNPVQGGFEIQIASPGLYQGKHIVGSLYDAKAPSKAAGKPDGEWNLMTLTCQGSKLKVILNGENVLQADLDDWTTPNQNPDGSKNKFKAALKDLPQRGHLGLQYHGQPISFRNVIVKPLGR